MPREAFPDRSGCIAEVSWGDHHLQVATLSTNPDQFVEWCRMIVERADARKASEKNPEEVIPSDWESRIPHIADNGRLLDGSSLGMFWSPERWEVQQLIKALRRARDRVWGADE